jgi:hypothetical protein
MRMVDSFGAIGLAMAVASPAVAIEAMEPNIAPAAISAVAVSSLSAVQPVKMTSGTRNGLSWTAASRVIGQTATSDVFAPINDIGGGNPIYKPTANKSGTVALIMDYANGDRFICSGSVLANGRSIATAAHCVSDGGGTRAAGLVKTTAYFFDGDADTRTPFKSGGTAIEIIHYDIHPNYTGEVIDQNDIAVLALKVRAPASAVRYDLHTPTSLTGEVFNVAGYGTRSTVGGSQGRTGEFGARTGYLREGDNRYDYAWGNPLFQGFFTNRDVSGQFAGQNFFGFAEIAFSYISDFDNGLAAQSQSRRVANALGLGAIGNINFNDNGLGAREVGIAGGDSGGPGFIDGKLASINSYGLTFGSNFGDFGGGLNSGWGEFSGYVPVYIHQDFIASSMTGAVPEPSSWAMLIAGFGLAGGALRRRRHLTATA